MSSRCRIDPNLIEDECLIYDASNESRICTIFKVFLWACVSAQLIASINPTGFLKSTEKHDPARGKAHESLWTELVFRAQRHGTKLEPLSSLDLLRSKMKDVLCLCIQFP